TIKSLDNDLFRAGLVDISPNLYEVIVKEAKKYLDGFTKRLNKKSIQTAINAVRDERGYDGIAIIGNKNMKLSMFVESIETLFGKTTVELRLSLPIVGTVKDNREVWNKIITSARVPKNNGIIEGELSINLTLPEIYNVIEGRISGGKKSFLLN
ncbi:hypothetical protein M1506_03220, partial [Patescibacteria group bacterium]|nr:hypothetical protein [Patescibacteria group bacterium]